MRSREHLLHVLAEAAELEHNLLCSYLFAAFSLKQSEGEALTATEWAAVERWRAAIMEVAVEEMLHLAQVANLMVAVGSRPHFDRPNLPVAPGHHPAGVQVALTPFDADTLQHFIYLERPESAPVGDGAGFAHVGAPRRDADGGALMPSAPDYATIGEFYGALDAGICALAAELGEKALFLGPASHQLRADEVRAEELWVVTDLASARRAIELIVVQGEGSSEDGDASHYRKFNAIADEYRALLAARPAFSPSRPVARNPVMRRPQADDRVHVGGKDSAPLLDAANAVYSLMLRCLVELYDTGNADPGQRRALLGGAVGAMRVFAELAVALTALPAGDEKGSPNAGPTFAMLRSTEGYAAGVDAVAMLARRFVDVEKRLPALALPNDVGRRLATRLGELRAAFADARR